MITNCPGWIPAALLLTAASAGCQADSRSDNRSSDWQPLFDGQTLSGWRGYHDQSVPNGWRVEDGLLHFSSGRGDLVTVETFSDFELSLEWKISEGGNSGIFYLAALGADQIYMSAPEMQVLDDERHRDGKDPLTSAGANYGLHPAPRGVVKPAGQWNAARIKVEDERIEHWLNGQLMVEYTIGSPEWQALVDDSKFTDWPEYGKSRTGHIGLQDHGDPVWYRNIRIRRLD
ncbi:MAG: DUF1080 domain-containing protein [Xanthomonadales bacterium]|nr:DUF1080 domain-containing protein [Xanthomonadales bacterium]